MNQEMRLHQYAVKAAQAFARANGIDRAVIDSPRARLGIVTTGKSYLDVLQALEYLGLDDAACADAGHPRLQGRHDLAAGAGRHHARSRSGLDDILVVEEKRAFIERQMKEYDVQLERPSAPSIVGKYDESRRVDPAVHRRTDARRASPA